MSNTIRIRRRNANGAPGAPSSLQQAELAFNEADGIAYIGIGTGGANGSATTIASFGGTDWASKTYVASAVAAVDVSSQLANYLTTASAASTYLTVSSASSTYLTQANAASTYLTQAAAASTYATPASVTSQIQAVVGAAPAALDTLQELAASLANDANFASSVTTSLSGKASTTLSNVDPSTGRSALGLGSMAVQNSNSVSISGGSIDNVDLNGGTY